VKKKVAAVAGLGFDPDSSAARAYQIAQNRLATLPAGEHKIPGETGESDRAKGPLIQ
jgi:hypothetical protein